MSHNIPERDWKKLRAIKDTALNFVCERIFHKINKVIESRGAESHKYYLKLCKVMEEEDKVISLMFDDLKRSTAIFKLAMWKRNGILSGDGMDVDEFFRRNADPIWLHQNGMWEYMIGEDEI